jgi:type VI secretion system secreted protein VgrG
MPDGFPITITTPPLSDPTKKLLFMSMVGQEELGRLFEYQVDVLGPEQGVDPAKLLGQPATVAVDLANNKTRYFNGFICSIAHLGPVDYEGEAEQYRDILGTYGDVGRYRLTLRPWLWFLTRVSDCRVYQGDTVPAILDKVFADDKFAKLQFKDVKKALSRSQPPYAPLEYCVQYRESYFNFISRLMEQEGIYYYFKHDEGKHTLVITDSSSGHDAYPGAEAISYGAWVGQGMSKGENLASWSTAAQIQPGAVSLTDYDYEDPDKPMLTVKALAAPHKDHANYEVFDYPGDYKEKTYGQEYAQFRIEELSAQYEQVQSTGTVRTIGAGFLFTLKDHSAADQNKDYLVVSARYDLNIRGQERSFNVSFAAIDAKKQYRAPATTPRPIVHGSQTAKVVGMKDQEIWTDEYNRVKVQFPWDRYGKFDEKSSCWVRVGQIWAGPDWGAVFTPRIGQEVIVDFLEGDPDRPLITGRVYNKNNKPPYPTEPTWSGIKSRSTLKGTPDNFNELRFQDEFGKELISVQAEKDLHTLVKNDETREVKKNRTKTIGENETTIVKGNRTETVNKDEKIDITGQRTETVGKDEKIDIVGERHETVGKDETVAVTGKRTVSVGKDDALSVTGTRTVSAGKNHVIEVGDALTITVTNSITITSGQASITLKKDGTIAISGAKVSVNGDTLHMKSKKGAKIEAGSDVSIKGPKGVNCNS